METIKTYIENMFLNLPSTIEVQKAKMELLCMMEDKYTELKEEGKTENEAVGIVISEFGNLDEIADSLGISEVVNPQEAKTDSVQPEDAAVLGCGAKNSGDTGKNYGRQRPEKRILALNQAKEYITYKLKYCKLIAVGVMLCIMAAFWTIFFEALGESTGNADIMEAIGVTLMFLMIAAAVILFVMSGSFGKGWEWVEKKRFVSDFATLAYVEEQKKEYRSQYAVYMSIGISLCIISVIPSAIMDGFHVGDFLEDISGGILLIMVGIGVFFIVISNMIMDTYQNLLKQNNKNALGSERNTAHADYSDIPQGAAAVGEGGYAGEEFKKDESQRVQEIFWPTISCIYLCWSFLTFRWNITWIIWPIAAAINAVFKSFNKIK